jgi:hypothetical protein
VLVYFIVILTVLMGFCGLAIDVGRVELRTNQLQAAADAEAAAYNDVVQVTTANGIPTPTIGGQLGSTFGFYVGDNSVAEVQLTQSVPTLFLGLLTRANSSMTLMVKSNAQVPPCMLFLGNPTYSGTSDFWIASSSMHPPIGCPTYYKDGLFIDGFANVAGSQVRTSGTAGGTVLQGWTSYTPIYSVPVLPDPLAYITAPGAGSCMNSTPISKLNQSSGTTVSLTPGTYCGKTATYTGTSLCNVNAFPITPAIDIQGTQQTPHGGVNCPGQDSPNGGNCLSTPTVNFAPGLYVIIGGFNFNCVTATGNGVTIYFTKSSSVGFGLAKIISSSWNVNAPTDSSGGRIAGVSIMNDRNWIASSAGSTEDIQFTYSTYNADGVIYLTGTGFNAYALQMNAPNYLNMVVANMYNYLGNVNPVNNYANLPAGNPLRLYPTLVQ